MSQFPLRLIRASAGTGKTFELSSRFIALLAAGEQPDRILATTFTRKAAFEIEERIFQRLSKAALDRKSAQDLSEGIGRKCSQEQAGALLVSLVRQQHRLNISTLDSFFFRIAATFSLELGLMPGWQPADPESELEVLRESLRAVCEHQDARRTGILLQHVYGGDAKRGIHERLEEQLAKWFDIYRATAEEAWKRIRPGKGLSSEEVEQAVSLISSFDIPRTKAGGQVQEKK